MKELPYFKFFVDEYLTGNIRCCSYETQGIFTILASVLWKKNGYIQDDMEMISRITGVDLDRLNLAITELKKYDILIHKDSKMAVRFQLEQMIERQQERKSKSAGGKKGMASRYGTKYHEDKALVNDNIVITQLLDPVITELGHIDKDKDKEEDKNKKERIKKEKVKKVFIPPTLEEVRDYCKNGDVTREYNLNAEKIYQSYAVADWHDSHGKPVFNWKQKILNNWCREDNPVQRPSQQGEYRPPLISPKKQEPMNPIYNYNEIMGEDNEN